MATGDNVMGWVKILPDATDEVLQWRDAIAKLMREASELDDQAASKRAQAYASSLALESHIRGRWSADNVSRAKLTAESFSV